jgi:tetratricopeptide (TPR) repeat protein
MTIELIVENAKKSYQKKKYQEAGTLFAQASAEYILIGDELLAAEMKNNQSVALLMDGNAQASLNAVTGTDMIFEAYGDKRRQGMALANQAAALAALKKKTEAISLYERSASLLGEAGEDALRADVMRSIAAIQAVQGKLINAVMSMQDGMIEVKEPSLKQRIMKKLLFLRLWR